MSKIRLIFVEDDATLSKVLGKELSGAGFDVRTFPSADKVIECVREFQPQVALLDLNLPGRSGLELLEELKKSYDDLQAVLLTGHGGVPEAVEAMRLGAYDFLVKPTRLDVLEQVLRRAAEKSDLLLENRRLRLAAASHEDSCRLLGESAAIENLRRLIARIGPSDASVLIQGENGTGKELIACNLHRQSSRAEHPNVVLNCAAVPAELVERELFGHERGAFTGADRKQIGLFEAAHRGTLVLDEVGELPLAIQPTLLRAIQFGEIRPVGSTKTKTVDVRVIAATNRILADDVREGRFREDLYYRLATFQIDVPALRERPEDIPVLARFFLAAASIKTGRKLVFDDSAISKLTSHSWSGNVRELENAVTRLSVLAGDDNITGDDVENLAFGSPTSGNQALPTLCLAELERLATAAALERHDGDKRAAAEELGISIRTLYNKLKELET